MTNLHKPKELCFSKVRMDSKQPPSSRNDDDDKAVEAARPAWRQHGERRRRQLIDNDRELGGTCFRISNATNINKYFDLAERVTLQFYKLAEHLEHSAEDAYVIGHRVIAFLEDALPLHPQFSKDNHLQTAQRKATSIRQQLETIAMYIDEQELNHWVDQEFDPQMDDDDEEEDDDNPNEPTNKSNNYWEPFFGWSSNRSIPDILETDESSLSMEEDLPKRTVVRDLILPQQEEPDDDDSESTSSSEPEEHATLISYRNSELLYDHEDDEDYDDQLDNENDQYDKQQDADTYGQWSIGKDFLKQIKAQKIEYETDSEAADSWAQDDTHTTATPPPPPVPHNSPRSDAGHYASYHRQGIFGTTRDSGVRS